MVSFPGLLKHPVVFSGGLGYSDIFQQENKGKKAKHTHGLMLKHFENHNADLTKSSRCLVHRRVFGCLDDIAVSRTLFHRLRAARFFCKVACTATPSLRMRNAITIAIVVMAIVANDSTNTISDKT